MSLLARIERMAQVRMITRLAVALAHAAGTAQKQGGR